MTETYKPVGPSDKSECNKSEEIKCKNKNICTATCCQIETLDKVTRIR